MTTCRPHLHTGGNAAAVAEDGQTSGKYEGMNGDRKTVPDLVPIRRALVSVFDKSDLAALIRLFAKWRIQVWATKGSQEELSRLRHEESLAVNAVADLIGYPEMPGGLVKTLHPKIYAGLLSEPFQPDQNAYLLATGAVPFDLVVCNLYPFESVSRSPHVSIETLRQTIDIGGPSMLRAAAKNFLRVCTVVDPVDYGSLASELDHQNGGTNLESRWRLARKAFSHVRDYDDAICRSLDARAAPEDLFSDYRAAV